MRLTKLEDRWSANSGEIRPSVDVISQRGHEKPRAQHGCNGSQSGNVYCFISVPANVWVERRWHSVLQKRPARGSLGNENQGSR